MRPITTSLLASLLFFPLAAEAARPAGAFAGAPATAPAPVGGAVALTKKSQVNTPG